jgi:Raf kinase inhibitor-like YbhB/YbcL family protein
LSESILVETLSFSLCAQRVYDLLELPRMLSRLRNTGYRPMFRYYDAKRNMKKTIIGLTITVVVAECLFAGGAKMKITSPAFPEGGIIPEKFSKNGQNVNPSLRVAGSPLEAKSLVLIVDDPDAPVGLFTHWLVWNIDPKTTEIAEKSVPPGAVQGTNDYPGRGYDGPQPPSGTHRYYFRIIALDKKLDLPSGAKRKELDKAMSGHVIAQGEYMGRYSHKERS